MRETAAGALFLRPAIPQSLHRALHGTPLLDRLLPPFAARHRPGIHAEGSTVTALPPSPRETRYARLRAETSCGKNRSAFLPTQPPD